MAKKEKSGSVVAVEVVKPVFENVVQEKRFWTGYVFVENGNPNGDPDNDGAPRQYCDGKGYITDVAMKNLVRQNILESGNEVLIMKNKFLEDQYTDIKDIYELMDKYVDVRLFGACNAIKGNLTPITAAIHINYAESVFPIEVKDSCITRKMRSISDANKVTNDGTEKMSPDGVTNDEKKLSGTMGRDFKVPFGVYKFTATYNPKDGRANGVTEEHLKMFEDALVNAWEDNLSHMKGFCYWKCLYRISGTTQRVEAFNSISCEKKCDSAIPSSRDLVDVATNFNGLNAIKLVEV